MMSALVSTEVDHDQPVRQVTPLESASSRHSRLLLPERVQLGCVWGEVVSVFFENMGLLLKRKFARITLLDDLVSGLVLEIWPKVQPVWVGLRADYNQPSWSEWFEFFHDAMARRMAKLNQGQSLVQ